MDERCHDVTDDQDGQVSRAVIGAVMRQILATDRAGIAHLQIAFQDRPAAAVWAFAAKSLPDRRPKRALLVFYHIVHTVTFDSRRAPYGIADTYYKVVKRALRRDVAKGPDDATEANNFKGGRRNFPGAACKLCDPAARSDRGS